MKPRFAGADRRCRKLLAAAAKQGWRIERSGKNHFKCYPPDGGQMVTVPGTPATSNRSYENTVADFRRSGLVLPR